MYLDSRGLVALWREGLLARAVLSGRTKGYRNHPQLERFKRQTSPLGSIAEYLRIVYDESVSRGYRFEGQKIGNARFSGLISVTRGQLEFEWSHLLAKLAVRDSGLHNRLSSEKSPLPHPLFRVIPGGPENWEKTKKAFSGL
ncbi:MAG: pyrimidine dimer DNA glycosylase/endonuclease V [Desulfobacteraceae bacterium]|nr:pyrimidine dimer DNA glycosylase/endonuclease V [Desulfobacteraceae bacterium]